jgi:tetratricopeptide (TPR) repeat protein
VKRAIAAVLVLLGSLAVAYGFVVTRRENSHRELIQAGDAAMSQGDLSTAIEKFSGAIVLKPDSMVGYLKRGDAYRRRDELEAALRDLQQAARIDPDAPKPRELLGDVNYARHRFVPAADHYQAYVDLDNQSPRVLYKLGLARYQSRQAAHAIDALQKAVAIDKRFAPAYYLLGLCQRDVQKPSDAIKSLLEAIELAPAMLQLQAREELADLYRHLGRRDDWIAQLEALDALDPQPSRDVALGLAYAKVGQSDRAVITLNHSNKRHPEYRHTFVALGRVWLEAAEAHADRVELNKALEALEKAVGLEESSEAFTLFGRALLLSSDDEFAERMLTQAAQKLPADPLAFFYLAEAAERRGHFDVARKALLDYIALEPEETDARRRATLAVRIGDLSMRLDDFPAAMASYERGAPTFLSDPNFVIKLATARWRAGDVAGATALVDKLLEKDPENLNARVLRRRMR